MDNSSQTPPTPMPRPSVKTHWWAIGLMLLATILTSCGQVSLKFASEGFDVSFSGLTTNWPFLLALAMYVGAAVMLIIAFSGGELSILDPLQSTTFFWTLLASWLILGESISLQHLGGIGTILAGIVLLTSGRSGVSE